MRVNKTKLEGVLLIEPDIFNKGSGEGEVFIDERGLFLETYNKTKLKVNGIDIDFVEDDISVSKKDVLRGIHGDDRTWKLISCLYGSVYYVAVNCDQQSTNFGKWQSFELNDSNNHQVLVPPKHGSAYLALSEKVIFGYKQSSCYNHHGQFAYKWNDPRFNIKWPIEHPILSSRDLT